MKMQISKVTDLELNVLQKIWEKGDQATVSEILESWHGEKPGYTTVLKTLQKMEVKGIVGHRQEGRQYTYYPLVQKQQITKNRLNSIVSRIFSGSKVSFAEYFIKSEDLNLDEISQLKKIIAAREKELKL